MEKCIEWTGCRDKDGYGKISVNGKKLRAHRHFYCKEKGLNIEDIDGYVVMHSCDNPSCINPLHLSIGTHADNNADKKSKGRSKTSHPGTKNGRAKINLEIANKIRKIYIKRNSFVGVVAIANKYAISESTVRRIIKNKSWI